MSLYDKASLVLIPSGTKAGKVFSQKPVPSTDVLTDDTLNNGDFEQGSSGWTLQSGTVVFSNGNAEFQGSAIINQQVSGNTGETLIVTYTVESANGNTRLQLYDGSWFDVEDSVGTHTVSFVSAGSFFYFRNNDSGNITVSSISAKKIVDGDFDFIRSTYATRVNSQGLIEKERSNLLLQSNSFDTTWSIEDVDTPTSGISGYDGTNNGWLLNISGDTTSQHIKQTISNSGVQTFSVYAKANTLDWMLLYVSTGTLTRGYFDIANGSLGSTNNLIDSKITDVGSGWYRCSITFDASISDVRIYLANANNSIQQSSGSIYIQDAQLEQGLVATDYIETTTSAVYTGITDNVPRLDYDGDCPSLLLEPQRQNLVIHSEYLEGLNQNTLNLSLSTNLSPEGKYNAYRAERVSGSQLGYSFAATNGETYTTSVYARSINGSGQIDITDYQGSSNIFNITSDWARYELSAEATQSTGRAYVRLPQVGDVVEFYGLQSEQGSYATSYIPTYGTSVTRNAEDLELPTLSTVFDSSGDYTVFFEHGRIHEGVEAQFLYIRNVSCCYITISAGGSGTFTIGLWDGTNYTAVIVNDENFVVGSPIKVIVRVQNSIPSVFVNGAERTVPDTSVVPRGFHLYQFNKNHRIYKELYFNEALTDQECIDLTT